MLADAQVPASEAARAERLVKRARDAASSTKAHIANAKTLAGQHRLHQHLSEPCYNIL